uniref:Uncharacterized protein n=1 Tax=Salix viminalis TaxID=40686 RepID=A0A6N2ML30_SALVM
MTVDRVNTPASARRPCRGICELIISATNIRSREKNRGADVELENQDCIENRSSQILFSLVQKQQKKSLPRQGELLTKYTSAEVLEKDG